MTKPLSPADVRLRFEVGTGSAGTVDVFLDQETPHLLIAGRGVSRGLSRHSLVRSLARQVREMPPVSWSGGDDSIRPTVSILAFPSPERNEPPALTDMSEVCEVAATPDAVWAALGSLDITIRDREAMLRHAGANTWIDVSKKTLRYGHVAPIVVVVDRPRWCGSPERGKSPWNSFRGEWMVVENRFGPLLERGPAVGVHFVFADRVLEDSPLLPENSPFDGLLSEFDVRICAAGRGTEPMCKTLFAGQDFPSLPSDEPLALVQTVRDEPVRLARVVIE